jgi:hypothetical protein
MIVSSPFSAIGAGKHHGILGSPGSDFTEELNTLLGEDDIPPTGLTVYR